MCLAELNVRLLKPPESFMKDYTVRKENTWCVLCICSCALPTAGSGEQRAGRAHPRTGVWTWHERDMSTAASYWAAKAFVLHSRKQNYVWRVPNLPDFMTSSARTCKLKDSIESQPTEDRPTQRCFLHPFVIFYKPGFLNRDCIVLRTTRWV